MIITTPLTALKLKRNAGSLLVRLEQRSVFDMSSNGMNIEQSSVVKSILDSVLYAYVRGPRPLGFVDLEAERV